MDDTIEGKESLPTLPVALAAATLLTACGGGGSEGGSDSGSTSPSVVESIANAQAARFLAQASMGATHEQMTRVQTVGYSKWLDEQMAMPATQSRWDWLMAKGFNAIDNKNNQAGIDAALWFKLLKSPDTLRQRVTLALSEIVVASLDGFTGAWRAFTGAAYMDILEANAFGNYRTLLQQITLSTAMGEYLTYRGNAKANPKTGSMPDENYARELLQLFTIGLLKLNTNGTPSEQETYTQADISGLARVFTGWDSDLAGGTNDTPDYRKRPMVQVGNKYEPGEKTFLGTTIASGVDAATALNQALDAIFAHPNVAPFVSKQLIQRLVTSNPAKDYVARVAAVFNNNGSGVKGDLKAVVKAILLDQEARNASNLSSTTFGKVREPVLRFTAWARAYNVTSPSDAWAIGNTSEPASRLGQSPLRSPSVFNFFRPGYVPPALGVVAPEFQIVNETSVVGYANYMQTAISKGIGDVKADYSTLLPLADNVPGLVDEINLVLAAGQLSADTVTLIRTAVTSMATGTDAARANRVYAALTLVMASPEFIVQK
ncbi:Uncharacterized conserved protein, DUF1800 family [Duganella sp. CF458]|uniref:DUF1800 domain-containing protein n=1 Tax=Duganella sp. CF458 TaxID=1884368 RepID=UPI0008E22082|nr:DUF1800 domain-containing protein [Duganella sp. CF458]SFF60928.1 Uncharacterized conserved protein, DUF1800 family [Duganella sp. CF458]